MIAPSQPFRLDFKEAHTKTSTEKATVYSSGPKIDYIYRLPKCLHVIIKYLGVNQKCFHSDDACDMSGCSRPIEIMRPSALGLARAAMCISWLDEDPH